MEQQFSPDDKRFMKRALALAGKGLGRVSPNPAVGAVVVKDGEIVGEGYHLWSERDHAEIIALARAGRKAAGAELYVTLEPCSHHGRTPPCADAIISAGIRKVFVAVEDPNPLVSGQGITRLRKASVKVKTGLLEQEAIEINEAFFYSVTRNLPFVTLKLAMSMDGRIATCRGDSRWITGEKARKYVHLLRFRNDAILVGSGTLKADNPSLDVRGARKKKIIKIVLDSAASSLSSESKLLRSNDPVIVFHSEKISPLKSGSPAGGVEYIGVPVKAGLLSWPHILGELGKRNIRSVLVEGGGIVAGSLVKEGFVNKLCLFYGSLLIGSDGLPGVGPLDRVDLSDAFRFSITRCRLLGGDLCVEGSVLKNLKSGS